MYVDCFIGLCVMNCLHPNQGIIPVNYGTRGVYGGYMKIIIKHVKL